MGFILVVKLPGQHLKAVETHFRHLAGHRRLLAPTTSDIVQMTVGQISVVAVGHRPVPAARGPTCTAIALNPSFSGAVPIGVRVVPVELLLLRPTAAGRHNATVTSACRWPFVAVIISFYMLFYRCLRAKPYCTATFLDFGFASLHNEQFRSGVRRDCAFAGLILERLVPAQISSRMRRSLGQN